MFSRFIRHTMLMTDFVRGNTPMISARCAAISSRSTSTNPTSSAPASKHNDRSRSASNVCGGDAFASARCDTTVGWLAKSTTLAPPSAGSNRLRPRRHPLTDKRIVTCISIVNFDNRHTKRPTVLYGNDRSSPRDRNSAERRGRSDFFVQPGGFLAEAIAYARGERSNANLVQTQNEPLAGIRYA